MANLRANNVCGTDGRNAITGSVEFDGTGDYLSLSSNVDFAMGTGDFTAECFIYLTSYSNAEGGYSARVFDSNTAQLGIYITSDGTGYVGGLIGGTDTRSSTSPTLQSWSHLAISRSGTTFRIFLNGIIIHTVTNSSSVASSGDFIIGARGSGTGGFPGFISNLRIIKGTALYTQNFIPPTKKLIRLPGTVLLCCQDNASATTEATGKTITANGNPTARKFVPQVGSDGGLVFDGVTKVNTQNYFYLPTGPTEQRGRGRGVFGGGGTSPLSSNTIDYVQISTQGNAIDFGDLTQARRMPSSCSSSTRGLWGGGYDPTSYNIIDYITIATTSNALDFGDLTAARLGLTACSNSTRGLFAAGFSSNIIDYVTIASTGNAIDFGDVVNLSTNQPASCSSSTRGVFAGGTSPTTNVIEYVTILTTGNALDFGDLTVDRGGSPSGCSSPIRGIFAGGAAPSSLIDYITIASTGNTITFGNLTVARRNSAGCSNSIRGVFGGSDNPSSNTIDFITIASTGNAQDFGDLTSNRGGAACSDSHGGLG